MFSASPLKYLLLSIAALATVSSAIPLVNGGALDLIPITIPSGGPLGTILTDLNAKLENIPVNIDVSVTALKRGARAVQAPSSIPNVVVSLKADLDGIYGQLKTKSGDLNAVIGLLNTVQTLLTQAIADVKNLVGTELTALLTLDTGKVLSNLDLAYLIVGLLQTLVSIVVSVVVALGSQGKQAVLDNLITGVSNLAAQLISAILAQVDGLQPILSPLTTTVFDILQLLGLKGLVIGLIDAL